MVIEGSLIHLDRTQFVQGCLSSSSMRRLYHIIYKASSLCSQTLAVSLDAEKAFDSLEWPYLFFGNPKIHVIYVN